MQSIYDRYNEREICAYREGAQDATRFRANHGDIRQTLFNAETDEHKIHIGFDDVELGTFLQITFKRRFDAQGFARTVIVGRGQFDSVMSRALDFLARHPHHTPHCNVDY